MRDDKCYSCGRSNPGLWGFGPALRQIGVNLGFAQVVVGTCVTLWVITLLVSGAAIRGGDVMSLGAPSRQVLFLFGASGAIPVFGLGRWWTVLSAGWLHAGLLHVLFNMYLVWQIGPMISDVLGPARTVILYTASGVAGFVLSSIAGAYIPPILFLQGADLTVGASASGMGLIGALYHYGRTSSIARQQASFIIIQIVFFAVVFGAAGSGVDNYAHLGGFAGGYFTSAFLNPMTRERGDHVIIAVVCLAASALAIIISIVTGLAVLAR